MIKVLYIDDEPSDRLQSIVALLKRGSKGRLKIDLVQPEDFERQLSTTLALSPDALILDYRLDQTSRSKGRGPAKYRATALAQEIRNRAPENPKASIPIFLCSTAQKTERSFDRDNTGHDLFDCIFDKNTIAEKFVEIAAKIEDFSGGYVEISKLSKKRSEFGAYLGLKDKKFESVDARITQAFTNDSRLPAHEYAQFITQDLLEPEGVLISEILVAARLGVSIESPDWERVFLKIFRETGYEGIFSKSFKRVWMFKLNDWWKKIGSKSSLQTMEAQERVDFLKRKFGLKKLLPAKPILKEYSTKYWTICKGTGRPIDPIDGVMIHQTKKLPWNEPQYVSIKEALEKTNRDAWGRIHPLEKDRLKSLTP